MEENDLLQRKVGKTRRSVRHVEYKLGLANKIKNWLIFKQRLYTHNKMFTFIINAITSLIVEYNLTKYDTLPLYIKYKYETMPLKEVVVRS